MGHDIVEGGGGSSQGTAYVMRASSVLELLEHICINISLYICEGKKVNSKA